MVREEKTLRKDQHEAGVNPVTSSHIKSKRKCGTGKGKDMPTLTGDQRDVILIQLAEMHGMKW